MKALKWFVVEVLDIVWYLIKRPSYSQLFMQSIGSAMLGGLLTGLGKEPPPVTPLTEREKRYVAWGMGEYGRLVQNMSAEDREMLRQCATIQSDE